MAEATTTSEELFTSTDAEGGSPNVSTTEINNEDLNLSEENQASQETETSSQEEAKQAQINAFYKKVKTGDLSLDEIPSRQEWMKPFIEARLESETAKSNKAEVLDSKGQLKQLLAEERAEQSFQDLKSDIDNAELTQDQKAAIEAEFADLRADGVSRHKALEKALRLAGVKAESRRNAMVPPKPNTVSNSNEEITASNFRDKLPEGHPDRIKFLNTLTDPTQARQRKFVNPVHTRNV